MLESNLPGKPFLGVRFLLSGFDLLNEQKVRSKLVEGGGIESDQYSTNCTHVIVDKIVYDDPLCVTARKDCKTLVTCLWVDHSFDIGMPVDAASVMYRPLKDLTGIPGANGLIMCLTGYQRQDRDDIMTMVGLMGAQFSKPLVANKVTHLICYKFEGEKYELAKKLPKIKLVNHRWLEDCLRDWEILPEENYNKSGYEMEVMEAEAKDSEEEGEDVSVKHYVEENMHKSPNLKSGFPEERISSKVVAATSNVLPESTLSKDSLNVDHKGKLSVHNINNKSDQVSSFNVPFSKTFDYQDAGLQEPTYSELPDPHFQTPLSKNATNDLTSSSLSAERPSHTDAKFNAASYSRKTPRRLGELSRDGFTFDKEPIGKFKTDDLSSSCVEALQQGIDLQFGERSTGFSPPKRLSTGSFASPNLQKINDAKPCIRKSPSPSPGELPAFKMMATDSGLNDNVFEKTSPSPFKRLKMPSLSSAPLFSDFDVGSSTPVAADMQERQNHQQDVMGSPASNRDPEINSNCPSSSNFVGNDNLVTKPLGKKMVAKKTLGSRRKLGSAANKKDSICMDKTSAPQNEAAICLSGSDANSPNIMEPQLFSTIVNNETLRKAEKEDANKCEDNAVRRTESLDDETETPEEKFEQVLENVTPSKEQNATPIQLIGKANDLSEKKSTGVLQLSNDTSPGIHAVVLKEHKEGNASENAKSISAPAEPSSKAGGPKRKKQKGNTGAVGKSKTEPDDVKEVAKSKEDNAIPIQLIGKGNILSEKKSTGAQHLSNDTSASTHAVAPEESKKGNASENVVSSNISVLAEPSSKGGGLNTKRQKGKTGAVGKSKTKKPDDVREVMKSKEHVEETIENNMVKEMEKERAVTSQSKNCNVPKKKLEKSVEEEKENKPICGTENISEAKRPAKKQAVKDIKSKNVEQSSDKSGPNSSRPVGVLNKAMTEPACFISSGHRLQRKEFQKIIRRLKGRFCRDSHQWSYQATHFIVPDPIRRTEKFFAAAASGRWVLKTDYLAASIEAGKFVQEEPYEWYKTGLSEDGAINLEAPRKWRLLRERTGHGAFHGMNIIIYGECIAPPLDTLKRVVKAGDGTILATSPPYTRFLGSDVDFAIVTPGMPRVDAWVQEFLKHEIPCVVADYLVEYVCKPGYSLDKHVLYNSHEWAKKSFAKLQARAEEVVMDLTTPDDLNSNDVPCKVCGRRDRGEVMLICGDESGSTGCGVGCHIDCCDPPFEDIPEDDWFCSECSDGSKSSEKPSNKRKKGTSFLKRK